MVAPARSAWVRGRRGGAVRRPVAAAAGPCRHGDGLRRGAPSAVAHDLRRDAGRDPRVEAQDYAAAVDRLLADVRRDAITPPPALAERRSGRAAPPAADGAGRARRSAEEAGRRRQAAAGRQQPVQEQGRELRNWWVEEMLVTDQPLTERMMLFWHNHFTSSLQKVRYPPALFRQNALFRREALGNFATLLKAVARDPAMLIYLDGMRSVARQPNENFARELLELFTLGEGHYSEADIKAAARAFTGWTVDRETGAVQRSATASTTAARRPSSARPAASAATTIIAILLKHPRTAETIVEKLWREFVSLKPDPAEVKRLAASFRNGNYEMKPLMRAILLSAAVPRSRQPRRADQVAGRADRRHGPPARPAGAGEDPARAHDAGAGPDAVRSAQRQGLGRAARAGSPPTRCCCASSSCAASSRRRPWRSMDGAMMSSAAQPARRAARAAADAADEAACMQPMAEPRPVEGRSLRNAGDEARLGPTLAGVDSADAAAHAAAARADRHGRCRAHAGRRGRGGDARSRLPAEVRRRHEPHPAPGRAQGRQ